MNTVLVIFIVSILLFIWMVPNQVWSMLFNLALIALFGYVAFWSGMFLLFG